MMEQQTGVQAQGGGYGPPPGGYGPPGGAPGGYGAPPGMPGAPMGPPGGSPMPPPGGAPMAPPGGGMPPGMGAPGGAGAPPDLEAHVKKWFTLSIVSIFCGCGLFGLINVWMAMQAKEALAKGDTTTAAEKIKVARMLCIVGYVLFGLNILAGIAYAIMMIVAMS